MNVILIDSSITTIQNPVEWLPHWHKVALSEGIQEVSVRFSVTCPLTTSGLHSRLMFPIIVAVFFVMNRLSVVSVNKIIAVFNYLNWLLNRLDVDSYILRFKTLDWTRWLVSFSTYLSLFLLRKRLFRWVISVWTCSTRLSFSNSLNLLTVCFKVFKLSHLKQSSAKTFLSTGTISVLRNVIPGFLFVIRGFPSL